MMSIKDLLAWIRKRLKRDRSETDDPFLPFSLTLYSNAWEEVGWLILASIDDEYQKSIAIV